MLHEIEEDGGQTGNRNYDGFFPDQEKQQKQRKRTSGTSNHINPSDASQPSKKARYALSLKIIYNFFILYLFLLNFRVRTV